MKFKRRQIDVSLGMLCGILYFIFLPLLALRGVGQFDSFEGTRLPPVSWAGDTWAISVILSMALLYLVIDFILDAFVRIPNLHKTPLRGFGFRFGIGVTQLCVIGVAIQFFLFVASGLSGGGHWAETKDEFLIRYGTLAVLLVNFNTGVRLASLAYIFSSYLSGKIAIKYMAVLLAFVCGADLILTGNRISTLLSIVLFFVCMLLNKNYRVILISGAAMIPFGYLMVLYSTIRSYLHSGKSGGGLSGFFQDWSRGWDAATGVTQGLFDSFFLYLAGVTEYINISVLISIVNDFGSSQKYLLGESLMKILALPIPRSIWEDKPQSITVVMGNTYAPGVGVSLIATVFGEMYANFGFLGVFLIPVLVSMFSKMISILIRDKMTLAMMSVLIGFVLSRMAFSDIFLAAAISSCILIFVRPASPEQSLSANV